MATTDLSWSPGQDLHVVAGSNSPDLRKRVLLYTDHSGSFTWRNLMDPGGLPSDVQNVEIKPRLAPNAPGVSYSAATGKVTVPPLPPPSPAVPTPGTLTLYPRNFLLEAIVNYNDVSKDPLRKAMRVHVHKRVERVWLTPNPISIHLDDSARFTVMVEFDDGVVADLTDSDDGLPATDPNRLKWALANPQADSSKLEIGSAVTMNTSQLRPKLITDPGTVDVTVELPAAFGGKKGTGKVRIVEKWETPREAVCIAGPGVDHVDNVKNVLILPEGFTKDQEAQFGKLARFCVDQLRVKPLAHPFGLVMDEVNFWMAFVPSREAGLTILHAVETDPSDPTTAYSVMYEPEPPPGPHDLPEPQYKSWWAARLLYELGLPTPKEANVTLKTKLDPARPETTLDELEAVYGAQIEDHLDKADPDSLIYWRDHAPRLLNDVDTVFGIAAGARPNFSDPGTDRTIDWNPRRASRARIEGFLMKLWAKLPNNTHKEIGATWAAGKDQKFLYFLLGGAPLKGSMGHTVGGSGLVDHSSTIPIETVQGSYALNVKPYPLPLRDGKASLPAEAIGTFAHELSHALGLGDEYIEFDDDLPADDDSFADGYPNLQLRAPLLLLPTDFDVALMAPPNGIWGENIKWRWPRIDRAAVLTDKPQKYGTKPGFFTLPVEKGHGTEFKEDDIVRLRERALGPRVRVSELRLHVWKADADAIYVDPPEVGLVTSLTAAQAFGEHDLVIRPVREPGPDPDTLGHDYLMVAPAIQRQITRSGGPLDVKPDSSGHATRNCSTLTESDRRDEHVVPRPVRNRPPANAPHPNGVPKGRWPRSSALVVGLFEGGARHACRIYHPTGMCLMIKESFTPQDPRTLRRTGADRINELCPVCRYALVDTLNPTKHGVIDADYEKRYPAPERAP